MTIQFACTCGKTFAVADELVGKTGRCLACGAKTKILPRNTMASARHQRVAQSDESRDKQRVRCPYCAEAILPAARKCRHCGEWLGPRGTQTLPRLDYASFGRRCAAHLIDSTIVLVATSPLIFLSALIADEAASSRREADEMFMGLWNCFWWGLAWVYYALMESSRYQGTVGKILVGIKVVHLSGNRISFGRASGRYFAKLITYMTTLIGYIMAAFTERRQTLHDMIAGCTVINRQHKLDGFGTAEPLLGNEQN